MCFGSDPYLAAALRGALIKSSNKNQGPKNAFVEAEVVPSNCKQVFTTHLLKKTSLSGEDVANFHPDFMLWFLLKTLEKIFFLYPWNQVSKLALLKATEWHSDNFAWYLPCTLCSRVS